MECFRERENLGPTIDRDADDGDIAGMPIGIERLQDRDFAPAGCAPSLPEVQDQ